MFPTLDGKVVAGPTAVDGEDKDDWSVPTRGARRDPPEGGGDVAAPRGRASRWRAYAGLRPAGRGVNYVIGRSPACARLVNVAAVRSTGLTASLGIAEHVCGLVGLGVDAAGEPLTARARRRAARRVPWWRRTAEARAA